MTKQKRRLIYLFPLFLIVATLLFSVRNDLHALGFEQVTAVAGEPIPEFSLTTLSQPQKNFTPADLRGHVSLINIWSASCHYCRDEHPFLLEIKKKYNIPIYGVNYREDSFSAKEWLESQGNPYEMVGLDTDGRVAMQFGMMGTPETYVVDGHGWIRYRILGMIDRDLWVDKIYPLIQKLQQEK